MANYVIRTETGDMPIPKISDIVESDCYSVHTDEITGTVTDPYPIWQKDNMFVKWYKTGSTAYIRYKKSDNTEQSATTLGYTSICAYYTESIPGDETTKVLNIGFVANFTMANNVTSLRNGNATLLYHGSFADAVASGLISDLDGWKDNPDPDYNPNVPQGGENADIDPISTDDVNNFLDSLPFDPEEALTSHQNIRMMQPYLLSASDWLMMGELFWKNANTSGSFFQQLKELFSNGATDPLSAIAGFIRLPLNKSAIKRNGSGNVYLGGVELTDGSQHVVGEYISNRYSSLAYSLQIKETFGTYFDYTRTKVQVYLPYCGQVDLNASEIMAGTLDAQYIVDVYTGDLLCTLNLRKNMYGTSLKSVIGRWKGNCAMPVLYARGNTQQHTQNVFNGAISYAGAIASGNVLSGIGTLGGMLSDQKIRTEKGGSLSGASGWFDTQFPYLIITRDVQLYPDNFMAIEGADQNATFTVSALSGFTKFDSIHVELANASDEENAEIESYLKNGIIL